jgi:hypothetical protein
MSTQSAKLVARIAENLPDMSVSQMQGWIENPKRLKQILSVLAEISSDPKVWRRVKLGTGVKDADGFRQSLKDNGVKISKWANDLLGKSVFSVATQEIEIDLVVVTVKELGFKNGAMLKDIYDAAKKRGFQLCPNEVGPHLRLQYKDQTKNEWLIIGMEPITDSGGVLNVFRIDCDDSGLWLDSTYGGLGGTLSSSFSFVFVLPRN